MALFPRKLHGRYAMIGRQLPLSRSGSGIWRLICRLQPGLHLGRTRIGHTAYASVEAGEDTTIARRHTGTEVSGSGLAGRRQVGAERRVEHPSCLFRDQGALRSRLHLGQTTGPELFRMACEARRYTPFALVDVGAELRDLGRAGRQEIGARHSGVADECGCNGEDS
jgi:hypothetical protein